MCYIPAYFWFWAAVSVVVHWGSMLQWIKPF